MAFKFGGAAEQKEEKEKKEEPIVNKFRTSLIRMSTRNLNRSQVKFDENEISSEKSSYKEQKLAHMGQANAINKDFGDEDAYYENYDN